MLRHSPQLRHWDLCPLRRRGDDLGVYLDSESAGLAQFLGWRLILPYFYVIVLLRPGRHRAPGQSAPGVLAAAGRDRYAQAKLTWQLHRHPLVRPRRPDHPGGGHRAATNVVQPPYRHR